MLNPVGFLIFFISMFAEVNRVPFDLPEAETELVSGYSTEYIGIRFGMFMMAEYVNMLTMSSLGHPALPGRMERAGVSAAHRLVLLKVARFSSCLSGCRATLPRLRYDRLMSFGWKVMLPVAIVNLILTAVFVALF